MTDTAETILVVVAGVETSLHVLNAAVERAEQTGASLVVVHVMSNDRYDDRRRSYGGSRELRYDGFTFTNEQAREAAESVAERAAQTAIGDRDIPYTAVGRVGDLVSAVLAAAATYDCAMILLDETYPRWRRVIGRADRRLASQFDGPVIRVPRPFPDNLKTTRQLPEA